MDSGDRGLDRALLRFPFTPAGQVALIEYLCECHLLDDRGFRSIHPRNTSLVTHLAYVRRQASRGKSFRNYGSSRRIHTALLHLLLKPGQAEKASAPPSPLPSAWHSLHLSAVRKGRLYPGQIGWAEPAASDV